MIVGAPWRGGGKVYNAAVLLEGGGSPACASSTSCRTTASSTRSASSPPARRRALSFSGVRLGVMVCEDMWFPDVTETLVESGAEILIVINGSPFESDKRDQRLNLAVARVKETGLPLLYVNQVCGQDELVFDGASFALDADRRSRPRRRLARGGARRRAGSARAGLELRAREDRRRRNGLEAIYQAMVLGLRDYVSKNRFPGVLLGLSGGIEFGLHGGRGRDALGAEKVHCVMMPSPITSRESLEDAAELARLVGLRLDTVSIEPAMEAFDAMLTPAFGAAPRHHRGEHPVARARHDPDGAQQPAGWCSRPATSPRCRWAMRRSTATCAAANALKDVYKMTVFALSRWRNQVQPEGALGPAGRVMPERVITKPPTAELKPDQTDQDTLPPYEVLDDILECLIEHEMRPEEIVAKGYERGR